MKSEEEQLDAISKWLLETGEALKNGIYKNTKEAELMVRLLYGCSLKEWEERGGKVNWDIKE